MNPSQLVSIAFQVYHARETRALNQTTIFILFISLLFFRNSSKKQEGEEGPKRKTEGLTGSQSVGLVQRRKPMEKGLLGTQKEKKKKKE